MIFKGCPGADLLRNPDISERICPVCGSSVEVFSSDPEFVCDVCGFTASNDAYRYAHKHPETELHDQLVMQPGNGHSDT